MMNTLESLVDEIQKGKDVVCRKCGNGIYKPSNTQSRKSDCYICSNCGNMIQITKNVIVE